MLSVLEMSFGFNRVTRCSRGPREHYVSLKALLRIGGRIERSRVKPDLGSGDRLIADAAPFLSPWLCFVRITFMTLDATLDGDLPLVS